MRNIVRAYVINLKRRPDRLAEFWSRFPYRDRDHLDKMTVVEAFDGQAIPRPARISLRRGETGCLLSHAHVWQRIAACYDTNPDAVHAVFEDDAHFDPDFVDKWENVYANALPASFSIVYVGGRFGVGHCEAHDDASNVAPDNPHFYYTLEDRTFHAYLLTPRSARHFLDLLNAELAKEHGVCNAVDALPNLWNKAGLLDPPSISCAELLCYSPLFYKTDVQC